MVRSTPRKAESVLIAAIVRAKREGMSTTEVLEIAKAMTEEREDDELITLEEASRRFEVPQPRLRKWLQFGHLRERGRLPFPARGGGKVLISCKEMTFLMLHPPQPGRPPKQHSHR